MKPFFAVAIAIALIAVAGPGMALDQNTLTVSANVLPTCKFSSTTSTLDFGTLDPSSGANVPGTGTTNFWCTKGVTTEAFSAGNGNNFSGGSRRMAGPAGDYIPYSLTLTPDGAANAGPTAPRTLAIAGTVLGSDYTGKATGAYSDTVVISLTP